MVPEGIGEDEDHRHHEAVDRGGLDHRQPDEERPGDLAGLVRLLRHGAERRGDRAAFPQGRPDRPDGDRHPCRDDRGYGDQARSVHDGLLLLLVATYVATSVTIIDPCTGAGVVMCSRIR